MNPPRVNPYPGEEATFLFATTPLPPLLPLLPEYRLAFFPCRVTRIRCKCIRPICGMFHVSFWFDSCKFCSASVVFWDFDRRLVSVFLISFLSVSRETTLFIFPVRGIFTTIVFSSQNCRPVFLRRLSEGPLSFPLLFERRCGKFHFPPLREDTVVFSNFLQNSLQARPINESSRATT